MKIIDSIEPGKQFVSLEFFPPKDRNEWPGFFRTVDNLSRINPKFVSVTYGAGGSTQSDTLEIVSKLQKGNGLETMAHLTCIGAYRGTINKFIDELASAGVTNILALRGDLPKDTPPEFSACRTLLHASDLVSFIHESNPEFGIAVAGYPETHPEAISPETDLEFLKLKVDSGGDFLITQLFFNNKLYFDFVKRARSIGIKKPIIPGIIPVVSLKVIRRIISMCGASIPADYLSKLEEADLRGGTAAVQSLGIAFARKQIEELLASGVPGVHLYTLNRDEAVIEMVEGFFN
jgi:methylenetetrahydrofolate reductase (NADPH)